MRGVFFALVLTISLSLRADEGVKLSFVVDEAYNISHLVGKATVFGKSKGEKEGIGCAAKTLIEKLYASWPRGEEDFQKLCLYIWHNKVWLFGDCEKEARMLVEAARKIPEYKIVLQETIERAKKCRMQWEKTIHGHSRG